MEPFLYLEKGELWSPLAVFAKQRIEKRGLEDEGSSFIKPSLLVVGDLIYMIPLAINSPFHISNETIKEKHLPSRAVNADIYMMYVAIIILFGENYTNTKTNWMKNKEKTYL